MRKAGPAHVLAWQRSQAQSVAAAAMAEKQAQIAQFNERANRVRVQRIEAWSVQAAEYMRQNGYADFPAFVAPEITEFDENGQKVSHDKNCLDTEGNAVENSEAEE